MWKVNLVGYDLNMMNMVQAVYLQERDQTEVFWSFTAFLTLNLPVLVASKAIGMWVLRTKQNLFF